MNGFEKSGIFPVNGSEVIHALKEKKKSVLATSAPAIQSLLPKDTRFKYAIEAARQIRHNHFDDFDSELRYAFNILEDVARESVFLSSFAESHIKSRQDRIAAADNKKKRGRQGRPGAEGYINSLNVDKIEDGIAASTEKANADELRRQNREWKRLKKQEDERLKQLKKEENERLKAEWRKHDKYDINGDGKPKRISFKRWKIWKGYEAADDVLSLHSVREPSPAPNELFFYDTSRPAARQRFFERLRKATNANVYRNPLREMPTIPSSDSVEITLGNSQGTPISEDPKNDNLATIHGTLETGDLDEQDADEEETIYDVDLTQDYNEDEPDLPPLPPPSPTLGHRESQSTYHRLMDMIHDHRQKRRRTT
ncbi:hypothetical protein E4U35_001375 [Claviceps purpurea]|nr:hypothetical protein E4U35_001375 [Claviceps purpurea]KAG6312524.1 hypothetical protein E4U44_003268 [Claviceps purpurea]